MSNPPYRFSYTEPKKQEDVGFGWIGIGAALATGAVLGYVAEPYITNYLQQPASQTVKRSVEKTKQNVPPYRFTRKPAQEDETKG